jgi:hypothetical protein
MAAVTLTVYSYIIIYAAQDELLFNVIRTRGLGYNDITLRDPCLIDTFKTLPQQDMVYSDNVERLYFFTGRTSDQIVDLQSVSQIDPQKVKGDLIFVSFYTPELTSTVKSQFPTAKSICDKPIIYQVQKTNP